MGDDSNALQSWDRYIDLSPGPHLAQLAGFVNEHLVRRAGLLHTGRLETSMSGRRADVSKLFQLLADARLGYRREALNSLGDQVVRPPNRMMREGGTCLDVALVMCAQLLSVDLRPHLVLDYGRTTNGAAGETNHALVLVDLATSRTASSARRPPGAIAVDDVTARWRQPVELDDSWVLLDPTEACLPSDQDFKRAADVAWARLLSGAGDTWSVDIAAGQADSFVVHRAPPPPEAPGLLSRHLPPAPIAAEFDSRRSALARLLARKGTTVLVGPRGAGKSVLGLQASSATAGAGWFLNGSSRQALVSALATAEGHELNLPTSTVALDVGGFATAALSRLHAIRGPWTVVIDNADVPVTDLLPYLPRAVPGRGQHLIVTTTDRATDGSSLGWKDTSTWRPGTAVMAVEPLALEEVQIALAGLPDEAALNGNSPDLRLPLVIRALRCLIETGNTEAARYVVSDLDPISRYWRALHEDLLSADEARLAHLAAVMPADNVPTEMYALVDDRAETHLARLHELGLISVGRGTWSTHRLLGQAVRGDTRHAVVSAPLAAQLLSRREAELFFARNYDNTVVAHLLDLLSTQHVASGAAGAALATLASIVDQRGEAKEAARVGTKALERLGSGGDPDLRATCLLARARHVNQHRDEASKELGDTIDGVIRQALGWAQTAEDVARDPMLRGKALAMRGLLTQKLAAQASGGERRSLLSEAQEMIIRSRDDRRSYVLGHPDQDRRTDLKLELAKAEFNLCGLGIQSAKDEPASAENWLDTARAAYQSVGEIRRSVFGEIPHRHVASCVHGEAIATYYRAAYVDRTMMTATESLRTAGRLVWQGLMERELLEPDQDREDVKKSLRMLSKIALARLLLTLERTDDPIEKIFTELTDELAPLLDALTTPDMQKETPR